MKPILFNTEMVRAILDGRKSVTRRAVKSQLETNDFIYKNQNCQKWFISPDNDCFPETEVKPPYQPGEILYVRETWAQPAAHLFWYRADGKFQNILWHPSIHMPKEAARIFLRVTGVRVERLQDINNAGARAEGCDGRCEAPQDGASSDWQKQYDFSVEKFMTAWDSTIKKADLPLYGWDANPYVWVIEFERISKEEAQKGDETDAG